MIDHTGINVSNLLKSKDFYSALLLPLRYEIRLSLGTAFGFGAKNALEGDDPGGDFWISQGIPHSPRNHIAFRAASMAEVDQFYHAAMAAGGVSNGEPGYRPHYHPNYYAAFVLDPDGYNIEAVYHGK
ncbi:VOC family protein [Edaphovirga cremea]|uniref:VOC family protein n=1 Tax=Edaphovirga cremea TaxID=2267246 RepID=UPI000DEFCF28|nr:VOC family protein [Edaphovirga cremea]